MELFSLQHRLLLNTKSTNLYQSDCPVLHISLFVVLSLWIVCFLLTAFFKTEFRFWSYHRFDLFLSTLIGTCNFAAVQLYTICTAVSIVNEKWFDIQEFRYMWTAAYSSHLFFHKSSSNASAAQRTWSGTGLSCRTPGKSPFGVRFLRQFSRYLQYLIHSKRSHKVSDIHKAIN